MSPRKFWYFFCLLSEYFISRMTQNFYMQSNLSTTAKNEAAVDRWLLLKSCYSGNLGVIWMWSLAQIWPYRQARFPLSMYPRFFSEFLKDFQHATFYIKVNRNKIFLHYKIFGSHLNPNFGQNWNPKSCRKRNRNFGPGQNFARNRTELQSITASRTK